MADQAARKPVSVTFWGAAQTVTGSMHLVEIGDQKVLLDCGLYQGRRADAIRINSAFPFKPSEIDVLIVSHAHIDHIGNIPHLVKAGFSGPIYCTPATRDLAAVMLADSAKIQEEDAAFLNKKRPAGEPPVMPLYEQKDVFRAMRQFHGVPYNVPRQATGHISFSFTEAGHLLGSAMVHLEVLQAGVRSITFTGDVGRIGLPILRDPGDIPPADLVISESTYGNKKHDPLPKMTDEFAHAINRTVARGGKILIPAFSLGRTQVILYLLRQLFLDGKVKDLPIFVDSPLSAKATEVYRIHPECFDEETSRLLFDVPDLFGEQKVKYTRSVIESKAINEVEGPAIIIAASGMCETGRILHHLKRGIGDRRNSVLIIGYQAPNTLGRRLVEHTPEIRIHDQFLSVEAEVLTMNGFSNHADRDDLMRMLARLQPSDPKICLVHGEQAPATALKAALGEAGFSDVRYPAKGESIVLQ